MTECTNPNHAFPGTGRILFDGECSACVREQRDELLEALKELVTNPRPEHEGKPSFKHYIKARNRAADAIAKAEGRS